MSSIDYTVTQLISDVKDTASIPTSQPLFTEDKFIRIMNRVLQSKVVPLINSVREEYFVDYEDYSVSSGSSEGLAIPSAAVGMKLRDVVVVNDASTQNFTNLPRLDLEQISGNFINEYLPCGYYLQNNKVYLWPTPTGDTTIRLYFIRRCGQLTSTDNCGQVDSINTGTSTLTLSSVPTTWIVGTSLDVISPNPGFDTVVRSITISGISGSDVTVSSVDDISEDDWVCLAGYSPIPQIPVELHQLLIQGTAMECLKSLGDTEGYQKLKVDYEELRSYALDVITPRSEGQPKKITNRGNGILDWGKVSSRWR